MIDGEDIDEKIIAIPFEDPTYNSYRSIEALPNHIFSEMQHFFTVYKSLKGKPAAVSDARGQREAVAIIKKAMKRYNEEFPKQT